jgi:hypothetical protein
VEAFTTEWPSALPEAEQKHRPLPEVIVNVLILTIVTTQSFPREACVLHS